MAEALGVAASILTLCHALGGGLARVVELYRAPTEIKILQEQLQNFRDLVQTVETSLDNSAPIILFNALSRARLVIAKLNQLINVKLLSGGDGSSRLRRRAWLRNKHKLVKLCESLKDARQALLEANSARFVLSTCRIEATLDTMGQQAMGQQAMGQQATSQQATGQQAMRQLPVANTLKSEHITKATAASSLTAANVRKLSLPFAQTGFRMLYRNMVILEHARQASKLSDPNATNTPEQNTHEILLPRPGENTGFKDAQPISRFEVLRSFQPEAYTVDDAILNLFSNFRQELSATDFTRTTRFAFFYRKGARKWRRLNMLLTTTINSEFWSVRGSKSPMIKAAAPLPDSLNMLVEHFLKAHGDVTQDSFIELFLSDGLESARMRMTSQPLLIASKSLFCAETSLQEITRLINHFNCPRYFERELVHRPLHLHRPTFRFLAYLPPQWVLETRFGSSQAQLDVDLYAFQVSYCLGRTTPGITPFLGIVLDDVSGIINAYLCELPVKGRMLEILYDGNEAGNPVGWDRCGKWCRQIVQAVAEVHSRGFVVGFLSEMPDFGVGIDGNDNAVFFKRFSKTFQCDVPDRGERPPEYHLSMWTDGQFPALPSSDLYQLGLMLWRIAVLMNSMSWSLCEIAGCRNDADLMCNEAHAHLRQLPSTGERTPQYLTDVITVCRAENPDDRIPAWQLLEMFPNIDERVSNTPKTAGANFGPKSSSSRQSLATEHMADAIPGLNDYSTMYNSIQSCNRCFRLTSAHYYHCDTCLGGDFDLCPSCFAKGKCLDSDHVLSEFVRGDTNGKYYAN